jgi:hypothetical protein
LLGRCLRQLKRPADGDHVRVGGWLFAILDLRIFKADGMWWGTAIEAPDPGALARFYLELLDWPIAHDEARNSRFWLCRDDG